MVRCFVDRPPSVNVLCFEGQKSLPTPANDLEHLIIALFTKSGKVYGIDFTCAQYGVMTKNNGHYVHIERLFCLEEHDYDGYDPPLVQTIDANGKMDIHGGLGHNEYASFFYLHNPRTRFSEVVGTNEANLFKNMYNSFNVNLLN